MCDCFCWPVFLVQQDDFREMLTKLTLFNLHVGNDNNAITLLPHTCGGAIQSDFPDPRREGIA